MSKNISDQLVVISTVRFNCIWNRPIYYELANMERRDKKSDGYPGI